MKIENKKPLFNGPIVGEESDTFLNFYINDDSKEHDFIPLSEIDFNPLNKEFNEEDTSEDIEKLAEDIKMNGMLHNIVVSKKKNGRYLLLSGERRCRAFQLLVDQGITSFKSIFAQIRKNLNEDSEYIILLSANVNTRGGSSTDDTRRRKASSELVNLFEKKFNLSSKEAIKKVASGINMSRSVLVENVAIQKQLIPELQELFDKKVFTKEKAVDYLDLDYASQRAISKAIREIMNSEDTSNPVFSSALKSFQEKYNDEAKKLKEIQQKYDRTQKILKEKQSKTTDESRLEKLEEQNASLEKELSLAKLNFQSAISETTVPAIDAIKLLKSVQKRITRVFDSIEDLTEDVDQWDYLSDEKMQKKINNALKKLENLRDRMV